MPSINMYVKIHDYRVALISAKIPFEFQWKNIFSPNVLDLLITVSPSFSKTWTKYKHLKIFPRMCFHLSTYKIYIKCIVFDIPDEIERKN